MGEDGGLALVVHFRGDLEAVVLARAGVVGEEEAEFQVLLVGHLCGVEDKAAVELAHSFVDDAVLLEKLELHGVALGVSLRGLSDDVVYFDVGGRLLLVLDEAGKGKSGELSDHCVFLFVSIDEIIILILEKIYRLNSSRNSEIFNILIQYMSNCLFQT